ncbi:hypothetical protein KAR91_72415 [Candidatus Pacearchaeota archaeon]|nr:hypothetical protein [Candidatus Pacearchaeota archaeon]
MKRSYIKRNTPLKRSKIPLRRTKLRLVGISTTSELKREIQALLRQIVIIRDGGCILRHYPGTGQCGGFRNDGELILQAEHLHTRSNSASFADHRLVVCLCKRHHIFWKPQHADEYYRIVKEHIGPGRTKLLEAIQADHSPHKMDWKLEKLALEKYLKEIS